MSAPGEAEREALLARLAESRAEISRLLEPPAPGGADEAAAESRPDGSFPRSRLMRALMSGRGLGAVGAIAGGLVLSRPRLAWRLLRLLPTSAVTRMVIGRVVGALRGKD